MTCAESKEKSQQTQDLISKIESPLNSEYVHALISGALDMLTPALSSLEMARRLPHAQHYCDPFSTHLSLLESPEWCLASIVAFLREHDISSL